MAAAFLGAVEDAPDGPARAAIARMAGGRRFFLAEFDVPAGRQAGADKLGYCALAVFRIMADDRATLRAMRAADFLLDSPTDGLAAVLQARARLLRTPLIAAWRAAGTRATEEAKASAGHRALRLLLVLPRGSLASLRSKTEAQSGRVPDKTWPCAALIEKRFKEVEDSSLTATLLMEVVSVELAPGRGHTGRHLR